MDSSQIQFPHIQKLKHDIFNADFNAIRLQIQTMIFIIDEMQLKLFQLPIYLDDIFTL